MNSKGMKTCVNSHGSETNHSLTSNGCKHVPHTEISNTKINRIYGKNYIGKYTFQHILPQIGNFKGI